MWWRRLPVAYLVATGWHYAGRYRPQILLYTSLFALAQSVSLAEPYVIGRMLNAVQQNITGAGNTAALLHDVYFYLFIFLGIQFAFWMLQSPARLIERNVQFHIKANYKCRLFQMATELPLQWQRDHHSGDTIDKISRASNSLGAFFDTTFEKTYMVFRLFGPQVVLLCFMPVAGIISVVTAIIAFSLIYLFDQKLTLQYDSINKGQNRVASAVHDYVTNIVSVITLGLESSVLREVRNRIVDPLRLFQKSNLLCETKWFLTAMLIDVMIVAVLLWYTHNTLSAGHMVLAGTFFTLFEYLRRIGDSFYYFAYIYGSVVQQAADVHGADPLIGAHELLQPAEYRFGLPESWKTLAVNNLCFRYADEELKTHHLDNVCLSLVKGRSVALVGESGSGKSTLLTLLRGLHNTPDVELFCDGKQMPGKLAHLSQCTTLLPQDPEIFADTIRFNITFGFETTEDELSEAMEMARFEPVLDRLPQGLDTNIAEKGVNLSGGEKQRVALARGLCFAKDSSIILMDEPTSSVDSYNERLIYQRILAAFRDKCVVSTIHRLHLLELFDEVYVFEEGRIVERGSFQELQSGTGLLASMWKHYQLV